MLQPKLYYKNNGLQKNDARYVLENYFDLVRWNPDEEESVMDVGCGTGDVTCELILPRIPKAHKLVGTDFSADMVEFASCKWRKPRVNFEKLNIVTESLPADFEEAFDHIFSFYCLHWVQEQRLALKNFFTILKPGGDMLISFLASNPIYTIYENMSKCNKWKPYMQNIKKYISPYHHSENPAKDFSEILLDTGFDCRLCKTIDRSYTYPNFTVLKQSVTAVCPFLSKLPENLRDDYLYDYMREVRRTKHVKIETNNNNNEEKINVQYKLFVVYATKPILSKCV